MSELQYMRRCNLVVAGEGQGLDLSGLRIVFKVSKKDAQTPNKALIVVYNLQADTAKRIRNEFTRVILQAGYESNYGVIFDGTIKQVRLGKENGTDSYLEISAGDGDLAYNFAVVNTTLAAGATQADQIGAVSRAMQGKGTQGGFIDTLPAQRLPRGKVMYGMARNYLRQSCASSDASWSIQNGQLQVVRQKGLLPDQAVVLTSKTGLVGTPEQTNDGIKARCLLNPMLKIGARVQIDESLIQESRLPESSKNNAANQPAPLDRDGVYKLLTIDYSGDTRGNDWYCDFVGIGLDVTGGARG